jgi:hypothetical protein
MLDHTPDPVDDDEHDDTEPTSPDTFNMDYYAEHALDPDDAGYLFGTAMGRSDS